MIAARVRGVLAVALGVAVLCACSDPAAPGAGAGASASPAAAATASGPAGPQDALACVARLPLDVRIGQTMLVTTTDLPRVQGWLEDGRIAGLLANGALTERTAAALEAATDGATFGALLAADEEGGDVQRYRDVVGALPSSRRQAATMSPAEVRAMWTEHAERLAGWGVDLVFAPVVDVGHGPGIGSRAFSDEPRVVAEYGRAAAEGISAAGLLPVLKHFPGHGRSTGDSHYELVEGPDLEALRDRDLVPYAAILDEVPVGVMVGHTTIPGYSAEPSSQSERAIGGLLVDELGFDGLIVSDALGMRASGQPTQGAALVGFLAAGGDLGIVGPGGSVEGRRAVRAALRAGSLAESRLDDAAGAVLAAKGIDPCGLDASAMPTAGPDPTDVPTDAPIRNPTEEP